MTSDAVAQLSEAERKKMSHGTRKHFKGRMGQRVKLKGGKSAVSPRAHTHGGNSRSRVGWSQGDQEMKSAKTWKETPGKYKVQLDQRLTRYGGAFENERRAA